MTCTSPIKAWQRPFYPINANNDDYGYNLKQLNKLSFKPVKGWTEIQLPCGKCLGCRLDHANEWATRLYCEAKSWDHSYFLTLTYNDKNLPKTTHNQNTLDGQHMTDFFKRLRNHYKGEKKIVYNLEDEINSIRYLYCGEYGTNTHRPHYHAILYNIKIDDLKPYKQNKQGDMLYTSKKIQDIWGKGFVIIGEMSYSSACYVARYCQKKAYINEDTIYDMIGAPQKEFIRMSRMPGLGYLYWQQNKELIKKQNGILVKTKDSVKLKPIPRYFMKLWEKENMSEFDIKKYKNKKKSIETKKELLKKISINKNWDEENEYAFYLKKLDEQLKAKTKNSLKRNQI